MPFPGKDIVDQVKKVDQEFLGDTQKFLNQKMWPRCCEPALSLMCYQEGIHFNDSKTVNQLNVQYRDNIQSLHYAGIKPKKEFIQEITKKGILL